jgi:pimeloyl-ACP methyl ester carboxylesterase
VLLQNSRRFKPRDTPPKEGPVVIQAKSRSRIPVTQPTVVHVRRSYADCRFGQLHMLTAYPSGGGFDERTPLLCLHDSGGSAQLFSPMLRELGRDRSIYALDLPGFGQSDPAPSRFSVADLALAVGDFVDNLRLRQVDVLGYQLGALIAAELAIARTAHVRRVVIWGIAHPAPRGLFQPLGSREDGSDVVEEWRSMLIDRGPGVATTSLVNDFADRLHAGAVGARAQAALAEYSVSERLPLMKQQSLLLRPRDRYWDSAAAVRPFLSRGAMLDLPEHGQGFLGAAPQKFAASAREFLDR